MELKNQLGMQLNANGSITNVTANGQMYQNSILVNELVVAWVGNISDSVSVVFAQSGVQITNPRALIYQRVDESGLVIYSIAVPSEVMSLSGSISISLMVRNSANRLLTSGIINVTVNRSMIPSNQETPSTAEDLQSQINVIKDDITGIGEGVAEANAKADLALANSVEAVTTANEAKATAGNALAVATGIEAKADTAIANSLAAIATAGNALTVALGIEGKADLAIATANTATATASQATADVVRLEGGITAFENAVDIRITAFENSVNAQISALEQQIVEKQGTKVTANGAFQLTWNSDVKANQTTMDETVARVIASESNIDTNTTDIGELKSNKSDKSQVALLNCVHSKVGTIHTFTLQEDSSFITGVINYTVRATLTANFVDGDTITLTDGVTLYTNITPLTTDGEPYEVELAVSVSPLITFNVEGVASGKAFFKGGGGSVVVVTPALRIELRNNLNPPPLSQARYDGAATTTKNIALYMGGYNGSRYTDIVDAYNGLTKLTNPVSLSEPRTNGTAGTTQELALCFGGYFTSNGPTLFRTTVEVYDGVTKLASATPLTEGRSLGSTATTKDISLYIGGNSSLNNSSPSSTVDAYYGTTRLSNPVAHSFLNGAAATTKDIALFMGGTTTSGSGSTDAIAAYNGTTKLSNPNGLAYAVSRCSGATTKNIALCLGGYNSPTSSVATIVNAYEGVTLLTPPVRLTEGRYGSTSVTIADRVLCLGGRKGLVNNPTTIYSGEIYYGTTKLSNSEVSKISTYDGIATTSNGKALFFQSHSNPAPTAIEAYEPVNYYDATLQSLYSAEYKYNDGTGNQTATTDILITKQNPFTVKVMYPTLTKVNQ